MDDSHMKDKVGCRGFFTGLVFLLISLLFLLVLSFGDPPILLVLFGKQLLVGIISIIIIVMIIYFKIRKP